MRTEQSKQLENSLLLPDTVVAEASSIGSVYFLLSQGHPFAFMSSSRPDTSQGSFAHTTFRDLPGLLLVLINKFATRGPHTEI
jgi:hypothetical protein